MTTFPHCERRNLLRTIEDGTLRINFNTLSLSFSPAEKRFWELSSKDIPADVHGPYPEGVEQFFTLMEKSEHMAKKRAAGGTATKERKKATTKVAKRLRTTKDEGPADPAVAAAAEAKVTDKPAEKEQKNLPGVETDRITGIESAVKRVLENKKARLALKESIEEDRAKIAELMRKNSRSAYKCLGRLWMLQPGVDVLKDKPISDK